jgi:hypothetical protein
MRANRPTRAITSLANTPTDTANLVAATRLLQVIGGEMVKSRQQRIAPLMIDETQQPRTQMRPQMASAGLLPIMMARMVTSISKVATAPTLVVASVVGEVVAVAEATMAMVISTRTDTCPRNPPLRSR